MLLLILLLLLLSLGILVQYVLPGLFLELLAPLWHPIPSLASCCLVLLSFHFWPFLPALPHTVDKLSLSWGSFSHLCDVLSWCFVLTFLDKIRQNSCSLFMNPCTTYEIKRLINNLPNKTSSGHDDISNKLLKEIYEPLLPALDYIVNESLKLGIFPTVMKLAEVVPLFKSEKLR